MGKIFIDELEEKAHVNTVFYVKDKVVLTGKNKKTYIGMTLSDRTGTIDARVWDQVEELSGKFEVGDYVLIQGFVQLFQSRKQLIVTSVEKVQVSEISVEDFILSSSRDKEQMFQELMQILNQMENPFVKKLTMNVLNDEHIQKKFKICPAAKTIHHAYHSGLLEHCLSICNLMLAISKHYLNINLDLLLFGAVFHDIGKIWELSYDSAFGYTDVGRLVGHLSLGSELVEKEASKIPEFPEELKNILKHLVLSHHGKMEYGSPKLPMFLEAFVVAFIDDFDSKMNTISTLMSEGSNGAEKWTRFHEGFERYFYLGIPQVLKK